MQGDADRLRMQSIGKQKLEYKYSFGNGRAFVWFRELRYCGDGILSEYPSCLEECCLHLQKHVLALAQSDAEIGQESGRSWER